MTMNLSSPIDLIKKSFDIFFEKNNFIFFLKIYAWLLPFEIFFLYQNYFVSSQAKILNTTDSSLVLSKYPWFLAIVILVNILFLLTSAGVEIGAIKSVAAVSIRKSLSIREVFSFIRRKFFLFILLTILLLLIEVGGIILLIIPGIIFAIWYGFAKFTFVDQDLNVIESLKASRKLVKGRFWKVLGRTVVFIVFALLFQIVFAFIPYGIGSILVVLFGALLMLPSFLLYKELSA